jgi:coatomer protein complex subunit alpha (xenin)
MIAILTGHSHYVMCSQFHSSQDLIVSCSLDQTLRLWDFSALRKKFMQKGPASRSTDMYSGNEVEIIAMLDGHERGINWCSFHPTENLIISGADDRKIKIWKYTETKAWEHDSLYGHTSNVSSCGFLP